MNDHSDVILYDQVHFLNYYYMDNKTTKKIYLMDDNIHPNDGNNSNTDVL